MQVVVVTPKGRPYRLSSVTVPLITFIFCCIIVMGAVALLLGFLFQLLVLLSPILIRGGITILEFAGTAFAIYRLAIWLWRLLSRNYGHVSNVLIRVFYFLCMMKKEPQ